MAVVYLRRWTLVILAALVLAVAGFYGPTAAFHLLPLAVTGEDERLAEVLRLAPGQTVAEIGAGRGALSVAIAKRLLPGGRLYSTELDGKRRRDIASRVEREGLTNVTVIEAGEVTTGLPDACCHAIFMRNVYHHITDTARFNQDLRRSIRPDGRLAIIDFAPGAFWHLRNDPDDATNARSGHGVSPNAVIGELRQAGFHLEQVVPNWGGRTFLVLFRAAASPTGTRPRRSNPVLVFVRLSDGAALPPLS